MHNFGKVLTAMVTPFTVDNELNFDMISQLVEYLIQNGSESLVVAGSTGEASTLTFEEKIQLFSAVKESAGGRVKVIAGTGTNSTATSIQLTKEAEKIAVDAAMLVVPYYNKPSQEGLYQHFKAIAESVSLPIILYNIPGRTVINLLPETVARLAKIDNIIALKESAGNMDQLSELKRILPERFLVYSGDDSLVLPMLSLGAHGIISVASHVVGKEINEMVTSFSAGDHERALQIHLKLIPIFKTLFITSNPVPVKTALNLLGIDVGGVRLPLYKATDLEREKILLTLQMMHMIS